MLPPGNVFASLWGKVTALLQDEVLPPSPLSSPPSSTPPRPVPDPPRPAGRFGPITRAVERRLQELVGVEIPEHRTIARKEVMELHYLEIECPPGGEDLLQKFLREFKPQSRRDWVRDLVGENRLVKLDCFAGVYSTQELPDTGHLDRHAQILARGASPEYRITFYSHWVPETPSHEPPGNTASQPPGFQVALLIHDKGQRREVKHDRYPLTVGRQGRVVVDGKFASGDHLALHCDGLKIWLEDRSKNGTWLDGQRAPKHERVELPGTSHALKLGREGGVVADAPEITLTIDRTPPLVEAPETPLVHDFEPTPIVADSAAVLELRTESGRTRLEVTELPLVLGKATLPGVHRGVSGEHLIIERITGQGAEVINHAVAKNGTALDGVIQPERFVWPFAAEVQLAPRWHQDPGVYLVLRRPAFEDLP